MGDMSNKMSGKAKEITGKVTNNKKLEAKGKLQHGTANAWHKTKQVWDDLT